MDEFTKILIVYLLITFVWTGITGKLISLYYKDAFQYMKENNLEEDNRKPGGFFLLFLMHMTTAAIYLVYTRATGIL